MDQEFEDCQARLPGRIVSYAAVQAWDLMSPNRRKTYLQWIAGLESEKAAPHQVALAAGLLSKDPETSQAQILAVSLNNKENVARLAEELLNRHSEELDAVFPNDAPLYKVLKVAQALVQVARHERCEPQARYRTLRIALLTLNRHINEGKSMFTAVFDACAGLLETLPRNFYIQVAKDLEESAPELHARFFTRSQSTPPAATTGADLELRSDAPQVASSASVDALGGEESAPTPPTSRQTNLNRSATEQTGPQIEASRPGPGSALRLFSLFEEAAQYIRGADEELDRLRTDLSSRHRQAQAGEGALAAMTAERDAALRNIEKLELTRASLTTELQSIGQRADEGFRFQQEAESRLGLLNSRVAELIQEKECLIAATTKEREGLLRQIQGTAATRIDELKNDIGFAIRRVVRDVPDKSTRISPDSAQRMLIRLHEVLVELERRGIRVRGEQ